jgi:GNAT superfamily N-acetyltransferase
MATDSPKVAPIEIVPLSQDAWPALAELFEAGGDPRWCWCQFWRKPGSSWANTTPDDNRADLAALVGSDPAPGLVAMRDGVAVGWVGLGPREDFPRLGRSRTIPQLPGERPWTVNCFTVAPEARGAGVAAALLSAAVNYARAHGAGLVEGYPVDTGGGRIPASNAFLGTVGMFERAGFTVASQTTSTSSGGRPRMVMRRAL